MEELEEKLEKELEQELDEALRMHSQKEAALQADLDEAHLLLRKDSGAGEALVQAQAQAKTLQQQLATLQQKSARRINELEARLNKVEGGSMEAEIHRREERAFSLGAGTSAAKLQQLVEEKEELESDVHRLQQLVKEAEALRDAAKAEQASERQKWRSYQRRTERASQEATHEVQVLQTQKEQVRAPHDSLPPFGETSHALVGCLAAL